MLNRYLTLISLILLFACNGNDPSPEQEEPSLYFPSTNSTSWETTPIRDLNWNEGELDKLYDFLETNDTRAFIMLKNGRIVIEKYWGSKITSNTPFDASSLWYWASAGKTLTATVVGITQQEGALDINDRTADYLGNGWTSMEQGKEDLITIKHQLTMTTGLNYEVTDLDCTNPECLEYKSDAGTQWFYHNGPYTLLEQVVSQATGMDYNQYSDQNLESIIGMEGLWLPSGFNNVYWSTARDMARFGLLMLNEGTWDETVVLIDKDYYNDMVNTSQELNPSYGYLWWLNGKSSIIVPALPISFNLPLSDHAPDELFAGIGKSGQFLDIVPSQNLVVIRMGDAPEESAVPITLHDEMWEKINLVINN